MSYRMIILQVMQLVRCTSSHAVCFYPALVWVSDRPSAALQNFLNGAVGFQHGGIGVRAGCGIGIGDA